MLHLPSEKEGVLLRLFAHYRRYGEFPALRTCARWLRLVGARKPGAEGWMFSLRGLAKWVLRREKAPPKPKLLFFLRSMEGGGTEKALIYLLNALEGAECDVTVLTVFDVGPVKAQLPRWVRYKTLFRPDSFYGRIRGAGRLFNLLMNALSPGIVHRLCVGIHYTMETAFMGGLPARIIGGGGGRRAKRVMWFHMGLPDGAGLLQIDDTLPDERAVLKVYGGFDTFVCVSEGLARRTEEIFRAAGLNTGVRAIHDILPVKEIRQRSTEPIEEYAGLVRPVVCGCGRLNPEKGFDRLVEVSARLHAEGVAHTLVIVGDGQQRPALERYIAGRGLEGKIRLLGYRSNPLPYIAGADLIVCPSRVEGFGLSVAEAMTLGRPVISTPCEGPSELIKNGGGMLTAANTTQALYEALKDSIQNGACPAAAPSFIQAMNRDTVAALGRLFDIQIN